ncbi:NTP transferase domain-containing protein [Sphingobacterium suaedae]|uniref:Probable molybdenum cofactor guanylyltransferase n=1 Tax=Sphingobacterium suaedae TaxID=1686402 RepID=A0ABW5KDR5_9SPHI
MISNEQHNPPLHGLVLAGGKSTRMGTRKDEMLWHGKQQRYYAADLLAALCASVYISCRKEQLADFDSNYRPLADTFMDMGPTGGILSALRSNRKVAWLVVACDLPLLDERTLSDLVKQRNCHKIATAYQSPFDGLPEPLITIWEPDSFHVLLRFLGDGMTCPRKVLLQSDIQLIESSEPSRLMNVNTPADAEEARKLLVR